MSCIHTDPVVLGLCGEAQRFTNIVTVSNCGGVEPTRGANTLTNVNITDHFSVVPPRHTQDEVLLSNGTLTNGESRTFTYDYAPLCSTITDTVSSNRHGHFEVPNQ